MSGIDHSKQAAAVFDKLAGLYQQRFMDVSAYGAELDSFIDRLPKPSPSILEIACGPGNITRYLLDRLPDARILGTDLAPAMIKLARANCPSAVFEVMDCRLLDQLNEKFDAVIAGFCLPYLNPAEAGQLFSSVSQLLYDGGLLYLSTIEGEREKSGMKKGSTGDEIHQYYYTKRDIQEWIKQHGLQMIRLQTTVVPGNIHQDTDIQVIAQKQTNCYK